MDKQHEVTFTTPGEHGFQKISCTTLREVRAAVLAAAFSILCDADRSGEGHIKWTNTATGPLPNKRWRVKTTNRKPDLTIEVAQALKERASGGTVW